MTVTRNFIFYDHRHTALWAMQGVPVPEFDEESVQSDQYDSDTSLDTVSSYSDSDNPMPDTPFNPMTARLVLPLELHYLVLFMEDTAHDLMWGTYRLGENLPNFNALRLKISFLLPQCAKRGRSVSSTSSRRSGFPTAASRTQDT